MGNRQSVIGNGPIHPLHSTLYIVHCVMWNMQCVMRNCAKKHCAMGCQSIASSILISDMCMRATHLSILIHNKPFAFCTWIKQCKTLCITKSAHAMALNEACSFLHVGYWGIHWPVLDELNFVIKMGHHLKCTILKSTFTADIVQRIPYSVCTIYSISVVEVHLFSDGVQYGQRLDSMKHALCI